MIAQVVSPVLIGRDSELARLEEALLASLRRQCRVVVLSGEAGVGKSRLVREVQRRARTMGCTALVGECSEADLSLPYLPFAEALGNHISSSGVDLPRLQGELGAAAAPLTRLLPQLAASDVAFSATDTPFDKLRLFEAVVRLLQVLSEPAGLLFVIEDIHWADGSTKELLDYVTRRMPGMRLMLLVTHRTQELERTHLMMSTIARWKRAGLSETIVLPPLGLDGVRAMVSAIFDAESTPEEFARSLHERSEGVPLAVEELLRDAVEQGWLDGREERWDTGALASMPAPRSLTDNIMLRVERLSPNEEEVLRCAAVLGRSFDFSTLTRMAELPAAAVMDAVDGCVRHQFFQAGGQHGDSYRFRHGLFRDAVYGDMIAPRRRLLHSRAADVVRDTPTAAPAELASHLIAAGRLEEAAPWCAAAGEDAMRRLAPREACDLFERALEHTSDAHEHARLACRLGEAWHSAGEAPKALHQLEEGIAALEDAGDALAAAHFRLTLGRCYWERSASTAERLQYERAIAVLDAAEPGEDLARAYLRLSNFHSRQLEPTEAQHLSERAIDIATAIGAQEVAIAARVERGLDLAEAGMLDDGMTELSRCAREARELQLPTLECEVSRHALSLLETYGRVGEQGPWFERLDALPAGPREQLLTPYIKAWAAFWAGDLAASARFAGLCITCAQQFGMPAQESWGRAVLCLVRTEEGDLDAAQDLLPGFSPDVERQVLVEHSFVELRYRLARGDAEAATAVARRLTGLTRALAGMAISDAVVEALVASDAAEARAVVGALEREPRARMHRGHLTRAHGRVQLASGDVEGAIASFEAAAAIFGRDGYRMEQLRTAIVLAGARAQHGDGAGATATLEAALAGTRACGAATMTAAGVQLAKRWDLDLRSPAEPAPAGAPLTPVTPAPGQPQDRFDRTGERLVSVLFADVRGFTALSERSAPADMADRIATFQRWALLAVERHRGVIDKFAGDAVMATFNAAGWHVNHAQDALEVAMTLVANTATLGLDVGAGVAVGPAIVGHLGGGANLTVLGSTTNLAARLQAQAEGGQVVLSAEAYTRVKHAMPAGVTAVEECQLRLKGFDALVPAYRLTVAL
jgi:class 3 adenylate cyclase/tetratricopeptide (TPR) repeat protein